MTGDCTKTSEDKEGIVKSVLETLKSCSLSEGDNTFEYSTKYGEEDIFESRSLLSALIDEDDESSIFPDGVSLGEEEIIAFNYPSTLLNLIREEDEDGLNLMTLQGELNEIIGYSAGGELDTHSVPDCTTTVPPHRQGDSVPVSTAREEDDEEEMASPDEDLEEESIDTDEYSEDEETKTPATGTSTCDDTTVAYGLQKRLTRELTESLDVEAPITDDKESAAVKVDSSVWSHVEASTPSRSTVSSSIDQSRPLITAAQVKQATEPANIAPIVTDKAVETPGEVPAVETPNNTENTTGLPTGNADQEDKRKTVIRFYLASQCPCIKIERRVRPLKTIRSHFHQGIIPGVTDHWQGLQCTSMAHIAVTLSAGVPVDTWTPSTLDALLRFGHQRHGDHLQQLGRLHPHKDPMIGISELPTYTPPCLPSPKRGIRLKKGEVRFGELSNNRCLEEWGFTSLKDALAEALEPPYLGAVMTLGMYSVAILPHPSVKGQVILFDSHHRTKLAMPSSGGKAILATLRNVGEAIVVLHHQQLELRGKIDDVRYEAVAFTASFVRSDDVTPVEEETIAMDNLSTLLDLIRTEDEIGSRTLRRECNEIMGYCGGEEQKTPSVFDCAATVPPRRQGDSGSMSPVREDGEDEGEIASLNEDLERESNEIDEYNGDKETKTPATGTAFSDDATASHCIGELLIRELTESPGTEPSISDASAEGDSAVLAHGEASTPNRRTVLSSIDQPGQMITAAQMKQETEPADVTATNATDKAIESPRDVPNVETLNTAENTADQSTGNTDPGNKRKTAIRFYVVSQCPCIRIGRRVRPLKLIRSHFHQGIIPGVTDHWHGFQCTSMAHTAVTLSAGVPVDIWTPSTLDALLRLGHRRHGDHLQQLGRQNPNSDRLIGITELPTYTPSWLQSSKRGICLKKGEVRYGKLSSNRCLKEWGFTALNDALTEALTPPFLGAVLTLGVSSVAILPHPSAKGQVVLFDSHPRTKLAMPSSGGKAILAILRDVEEAIVVLRHQQLELGETIDDVRFEAVAFTASFARSDDVSTVEEEVVDMNNLSTLLNLIREEDGIDSRTLRGECNEIRGHSVGEGLGKTIVSDCTPVAPPHRQEDSVPVSLALEEDGEEITCLNEDAGNESKRTDKYREVEATKHSKTGTSTSDDVTTGPTDITFVAEWSESPDVESTISDDDGGVSVEVAQLTHGEANISNSSIVPSSIVQPCQVITADQLEQETESADVAVPNAADTEAETPGYAPVEETSKKFEGTTDQSSRNVDHGAKPRTTIRFHLASQCPCIRIGRRVRPLKTIRSHFHQGNIPGVTDHWRGLQCTAVTLSAGVPVDRWAQSKLDALLRFDHRRHGDHLQQLGGQYTHKNPMIGISELRMQTPPRLPSPTRGIRFKKGSVRLFELASNRGLGDALTAALKPPPRCAVRSLVGSSFAIVPHSPVSGQVVLFDGQPRTNLAMPSPSGKATLAILRNIKEATVILRHQQLDHGEQVDGVRDEAVAFTTSFVRSDDVSPIEEEIVAFDYPSTLLNLIREEDEDGINSTTLQGDSNEIMGYCGGGEPEAHGVPDYTTTVRPHRQDVIVAREECGEEMTSPRSLEKKSKQTAKYNDEGTKYSGNDTSTPDDTTMPHCLQDPLIRELTESLDAGDHGEAAVDVDSTVWIHYEASTRSKSIVSFSIDQTCPMITAAQLKHATKPANMVAPIVTDKAVKTHREASAVETATNAENTTDPPDKHADNESKRKTAIRFYLSSQCPYIHIGRRIRPLKMVRSGYHQGAIPGVTDHWQGFQCTTMAFTALTWSVRVPVDTWIPSTLDALLKFGHQRHGVHLQQLGRLHPHKDPMIGVSELPTFVPLRLVSQERDIRLKKGEVRFGELASNRQLEEWGFTTLEDALAEALKPPSLGAVVTLGVSSVAILPHPSVTGQVVLFDSHQRNRLAMSSSGGKCILATLQNVGEAIVVLRHQQAELAEIVGEVRYEAVTFTAI